MKSIIGIIPARYGSTRFPGKPLVQIQGRSMVQRVVEQAMQAPSLHRVVVATDDDRIHQHITNLGYPCVMTSATHQSGTDRCLEALLAQTESYDAVINIQGDEPFIDPQQIEALTALVQQRHVQIGTLVMPIADEATLHNPNKVKVVTAEDGRALYFSRQAIPYLKDVPPAQWLKGNTYYKHIGMYGYKTEVLRAICKLPVSNLEKAESLEQLRWLQHGYSIHAAITHHETPAIDTPDDLEKILNELRG
ncbi:MAG: 3-deoxy-manno-octulosonate cytidylyltransferase [Flavobacteriales bacterium]